MIEYRDTKEFGAQELADLFLSVEFGQCGSSL